MDSADQNPVPDSRGGASDDDWIVPVGFRRPDQARDDWQSICDCGVPADLLDAVQRLLIQHLATLDDKDAAISNLSQFVMSSRSPTALLALFERDESSLLSLLHIFSTSQALAQFLIDDTEGFDLMRASDGLPAQRRFLVDELVAETQNVDDAARVTKVVESFIHRELVRIAYGEFVRNLSPDQAGRQLAWVADAAIESALEFAQRRCLNEFGPVQRTDGGVPQISVIALGSYGALELNYASNLEIMFVYDAIDEKNPAQRELYNQIALQTVAIISPAGAERSQPRLGFTCDLARGPHLENSCICSVDESIDLLESKNRTWQRMVFAKARFAGGVESVGNAFLTRAQPWIYRRFVSQNDFADVRTLRYKLEHRASNPGDDSQEGDHGKSRASDVLRSAGGRRDIELTVQFLQLLHGADSPSLRIANTNDAIIALEKDGCLLHEESELFSSSYARLCRLHHQLSIMFGSEVSTLPNDEKLLQRIAWRLGVCTADNSQGDSARFTQQLAETFTRNCTVINHLMIDAPDDGGGDDSWSVSASHVETELLLDNDAPEDLINATLTRHGILDPLVAMENLRALSVESVRFLSPRRCRHFLAAIVPKLLTEIARTPYPDATLQSLVEVTDSLGAKATLWELLGANPPTMDLMVRLCASTEYLRKILIDNPGMIDELIDSLLMDRLPSGERLDAQSIELCRGAADVDLILQGFKNSAHLTIGVRDILNKQSVEATHRALADTAEACLRRVIENEQAGMAAQYGDPIGEDGEPAEMLAIALGKFGGREPNYHSDLDVIFLYSSKGETQRRVGGPRSTVSNHRFFNQLARRVVDRIDRGGSNSQRLYELDGRLSPTGDEGTLAVSVNDFLKRFEHGVAPLWQRVALCKARTVSGSRRLRRATDVQIKGLIAKTHWYSNMAAEIRQMRMRMQDTAASNNLKRAEGGSVDAEVIAQMLTLRYASENSEIIQQGTIDSLDALAQAGYLPESQAIALSNSYRTLRRIESRLRLSNTDGRHELPRDLRKLSNLAFLMGESDPNMITAQTKQARHSIRNLFNQVFDSMID